eukprot:CAMPEP_0198228674 /NCGR_PEP_ID=MMETSP1445-20131203/113720_1 /TAXON_ID=36898 /ORGANISM="Pyramimonas sp., Strain CCMP2087" /LENGTH=333 /DNA_ID=CAMNT_0043909091 /DNA_START=363 /DNA_END=1364 /DNA_ORIENTATION=+
MLEAELPEMLTVKRLRHEASISVHAEATAGRWFHPSCLGRDPAGASNHHWYGLDNDTRRCSKRDQTHKLCGDCLKLWCDSEGEVRGEAGFLARNMEEEQPSEKVRKRRVDVSANMSRVRERKAIAKHAELGDCKLVLTITRNGQSVPFACPNLQEIMEATDPLSKRISDEVQKIATAWEAVTVLWKQGVPTGESKNSDEDAHVNSRQRNEAAADEALFPSQSPLRNMASRPERDTFFGPGGDSEELPGSVGHPPARPQVPTQPATERVGDAALSPSRRGASTNEAEGTPGSDGADAEEGGDSRANPPAVHTAQGDPPAQGPTQPATIDWLTIR